MSIRFFLDGLRQVLKKQSASAKRAAAPNPLPYLAQNQLSRPISHMVLGKIALFGLCRSDPQGLQSQKQTDSGKQTAP
jgi:hypothetical protein